MPKIPSILPKLDTVGLPWAQHLAMTSWPQRES